MRLVFRVLDNAVFQTDQCEFRFRFAWMVYIVYFAFG